MSLVFITAVSAQAEPEIQSSPDDLDDGMSREELEAPVSDDLVERFNRLARRARSAEQDGLGAVIKIYAEAILDPEYQAYGKIHLKLGQLLKEQGRRVDAAYHFRECLQDHRVDELDRNVICKTGFEDTTTTLEILDAPPRAKVVLLEPSRFSGPFKSGDRLPLGRVRFVIEVPGYFPHEATLNLEGPTRWQTELGMKRPRGPLVPDDFLGEEPSAAEPMVLQDETLIAPPPKTESRSKLPYWLVGGLGVAVGTAGLIIGLDAVQKHDERPRRHDPNKLREQAITGDIMAWSGLSVAAGTLAWYFLTPFED